MSGNWPRENVSSRAIKARCINVGTRAQRMALSLRLAVLFIIYAKLCAKQPFLVPPARRPSSPRIYINYLSFGLHRRQQRRAARIIMLMRRSDAIAAIGQLHRGPRRRQLSALFILAPGAKPAGKTGCCSAPVQRTQASTANTAKHQSDCGETGL